MADLLKFSCTLYCLHEYVADITAVSPLPIVSCHAVSMAQGLGAAEFCSLLCVCIYVPQLAGPSMLPTFHESGDIVLVDCLFVKMGRELKKGDIVIAKSPSSPGATVCKRILGLVSKRYNSILHTFADHVCVSEWVPCTTARRTDNYPAAILVPAGAGSGGKNGYVSRNIALFTTLSRF